MEWQGHYLFSITTSLKSPDSWKNKGWHGREMCAKICPEKLVQESRDFLFLKCNLYLHLSGLRIKSYAPIFCQIELQPSWTYSNSLDPVIETLNIKFDTKYSQNFHSYKFNNLLPILSFQPQSVAWKFWNTLAAQAPVPLRKSPQVNDLHSHTLHSTIKYKLGDCYTWTHNKKTRVHKIFSATFILSCWFQLNALS